MSELKLQLEQLIYGQNSKICVNSKTGELSDKDGFSTRLGSVQVFDVIGGRSLSRTIDRPSWETKQTVTERDGKKYSNFEKGREYGLWEKLARQLSVVSATTEDEIKTLLTPYLAMGSLKLFMATKANKAGLSNNTESHILKLFGIEKNSWVVGGDIESMRPNFSEFNKVMRDNNLTDWVVRTPETNLIAQQGAEIAELKKLVEQLAKKIQTP